MEKAVAPQKYADKYIELHLHLDGAVTTDIARKLAKIQGIPLPQDDSELEKQLTVPNDCENLNDFLKCFALPLSFMQTKEGLSEAVRLVSENIRSQGVVYAEIRFAPQLHTEKGMTQEDAVKAALKGISETELKVNLILCCMRGEGNEAANDETVELAKKYLVKDGGVVAIDLAGAEALFPTEKYRELFKKAKACHAVIYKHVRISDYSSSFTQRMEKPFTQSSPVKLLPVSEEFTTNWLPFLSMPYFRIYSRYLQDMQYRPLSHLYKGLNYILHSQLFPTIHFYTCSTLIHQACPNYLRLHLPYRQLFR